MSSLAPGVVTSLVTPFTRPHSDEAPCVVDEFRFESLVRWQIDAGIPALATAGWIGEGPTLSRDERRTLVAIAARAARGRAAILAHVGSSDTARSLEYALDAAMAGANALVIVQPPYNKPNGAGFHRHVETIARATDLPVYVEFDTARTRVSVSVYEMAALLDIPGVAGIVDHSANPMHVEALSASRKRTACFLAAHEPSCIAAEVFGASGLFSAIANVAPAAVLGMAQACERGDFPAAREIHEDLLPLILAVEDEGVAALKYAMIPALGIDPGVRLPLVPLGRSARRRVCDAVDAFEASALPASRLEAVS